jgi:hypothetical protein
VREIGRTRSLQQFFFFVSKMGKRTKQVSASRGDKSTASSSASASETVSSSEKSSKPRSSEQSTALAKHSLGFPLFALATNARGYVAAGGGGGAAKTGIKNALVSRVLRHHRAIL